MIQTNTKYITHKIKNRRVKCILINNPSNPCGSVLSLSNLKGTMALAEKYQMQIMSYEIYANVVFNNNKNLYH